MPKTMAQLGIGQFFSWFGLFSMWVYTTPAVADRFFGNDRPVKQRFSRGRAMGRVPFDIYNAGSNVFCIISSRNSKIYRKTRNSRFGFGMWRVGAFVFRNIYRCTHACLVNHRYRYCLVSILAMPYAILAGSHPVFKMGYMGIFNFFITIPQIINWIFNGFIVEHIYNIEAIYALSTAGIFVLIAALSVFSGKTEIINI
ncbi:MAG: hypothetical protein V8R52_11720 [Coprobacter fastidiosus]